MKADWYNRVIAQSNNTIVMVRQPYSPVDSAAWYYLQFKQAAVETKDYVTFWKGVQVSE